MVDDNVHDYVGERAARGLGEPIKRTLDEPPIGGGPRGPEDIDMVLYDRLGRLDGVVEGLKHGQTQLLVSIGIVAAFVVGFGIYTLQRIDQTSDRVDKLGDKVNEFPSKISSELRDILRVVAESITATKQQVPQVIFIPAPQLPPPAPVPSPSQPLPMPAPKQP